MTDTNELEVETWLENASVQFVRSNPDESTAAPDAFLAICPITVVLRAGGVETESYLSLQVPVTRLPRDTSYDLVEMRAAEALAPALRRIADQVEDLVAKTGS